MKIGMNERNHCICMCTYVCMYVSICMQQACCEMTKEFNAHIINEDLCAMVCMNVEVCISMYIYKTYAKSAVQQQKVLTHAINMCIYMYVCMYVCVCIYA